MSTINRAAKRAALVFLAAGLLALGYAGYVVIDTRMYQSRQLKQLTLLPAVAPPAASLPVSIPPPPDGVAIGQIEIARLGVSVVVVQGESDSILERAIGHLARTAMPGMEGNVVLAGHRDTFFRPLKDIVEGDRITLKTPGRDFDYVVESTSIVTPKDVYVLDATGGETLTLITCYPFYYVGSAPNRFIVRARAVSTAQTLRLAASFAVE